MEESLKENKEVVSRRIYLLSAAINDIEQAVDYYNTQKEHLGESFLNELEKLFDILIAFPEIFPVKRKNFREAVMKKFPYVVVYGIDKDKILVYAVFHTHRSPDKKP
jgi:plasmid stabilization system protein ParE